MRKLKKARKILKPDFLKVLVAYFLFFILLTLNDAFYWCRIAKSKDYCPPNFYQVYFFKFIIGIVNPWVVFTRISRDLIEQNFSDILLIFLFMGIAYILSSLISLVKREKTRRLKYLQKLIY